MDLPLKHRKWVFEKEQPLFIQSFLTSLPSLFHIDFILVHDILYGRIL